MTGDSAQSLALADTAVRPRGGKALLLALWLAAGLLLTIQLGRMPLTRTQEARVLEVGREMLQADWDGWIIPHAGGIERLQKPPLAYWLSAAAYTVFGVSEGAGRLPLALASWLTLGVTAWGASWLFNRTTAVLAAIALLGCFLFVRFGRLAETDALSLLFTTAATLCLWRAAESAPGRPRETSASAWYHAAAALIGLASLSKGLPAFLPLLFFAALVLWTRRWGLLKRLLLSGAPITFLLIATPWWLYVLGTRGSERLWDELTVVSEGRGHGGWFTKYFWYLAYGLLPWTLLVVAALVEAVRHWKTDVRMRGLLLWIATIFLPLCLMGNKQPHYAMPLLPPLMILLGWLLGRYWEMDAPPDFLLAMRRLIGATLIGTALMPAGVLIAAWTMLHTIRPIDWMAAAIALGLWLSAIIAHRRCDRRRGLTAFVAALTLSVTLLGAIWAPSLERPASERLKAALYAEVQNGPACIYGPGTNLTFCFWLGRVLPVISSPEALRLELDQHPDTVVMVLNLTRAGAAKPPAWLVERRRERDADQVVGFFVPAQSIEP